MIRGPPLSTGSVPYWSYMWRCRSRGQPRRAHGPAARGQPAAGPAHLRARLRRPPVRHGRHPPRRAFDGGGVRDGEASLRPRGAWHAYEAADGGARRLTLVKKQLGGGLDDGVHVEAVMAVEVFEVPGLAAAVETERADLRSEEHTSELPSPMRLS